MAKIVKPSVAGKFKGRVGNLVFKNYSDKVVITSVPVFTKPPTQRQKAQRERFRKAMHWAKSAIMDSPTRELYAEAAAQQGKNAINLAVADRLRPPELQEVDLTRYEGKVGDVILVEAANIIRVARVSVQIIDDKSGNTIEQGEAKPSGGGARVWTFAVTKACDRNSARVIVAVVDLAGNRVEERVW